MALTKIPVEPASNPDTDHDERHRMRTLAAMADADAGRLIDHDEIRAWAANLDSDDKKPAQNRG
jgi:hypothetical protein